MSIGSVGAPTKRGRGRGRGSKATVMIEPGTDPEDEYDWHYDGDPCAAESCLRPVVEQVDWVSQRT